MSSYVTTPHRCCSGRRRRLEPPRHRNRIAAVAPRRRAVAARAMSAEAPLGVTPAAAEGKGAAVAEMVEEAAVWCAVHGLVVGDRAEPDSLSRTRQVDDFTARLLDIHAKMMEVNKKETIRKTLAQVEAEGQVLPDGTLVVFLDNKEDIAKLRKCFAGEEAT
uniref:Uncharacterized protein n=1 Tax=Leersia perrieri TaxID=77586 RepID=A0A0D9XUM5_9ORYZ